MNLQAFNRNMAVNHGGMMEMTCVLKVNPQCPACKGKLDDVLQCTKGQYSSFTMDGESQRVKITGRVDPGLLMQVLSRSDGHGEVALIQLNNYGESYYGNNDHHYMTNYYPQDAYNGYYQPALPADRGYYHYPYPSNRCLCNIM